MSKREQELMETRTDKTWPTNKFSFAERQEMRTCKINNVKINKDN